MAKKPIQDISAEVPREPVAVYEIPAGLRDSDLGLSSNRTISAWAMDRVLAFLGVHVVEIIDGVATSLDGQYCELVRNGDSLQLFDRL